MDIQGISSGTSLSTQKVTEVTQSVEGEKNPVTSSVPSPALEVASPQHVEAQVKSVNALLDKMGQSITFGIDQDTDATIVKVVDKNTDELIRQLPSEDSLKLMKNIQEYLERAQQTGGLSKEGLTGSLFNEII